MAGYSYSEIQDMQQKAMARVRQMQKASDEALGKAQKDIREHSTEERRQSTTPIAPKITNMPPNFPENNIYPSFKDFFNEEEKKEVQPTIKKENKPQKTGANSFESLFAEPDKAILMGLVMLLKSEGADEMLIMALLYIMS